MNKAIAMIRILLVGIGFIVFVGIWCQLQNQKQVEIVRIPDPNYVQNIYEAQERLKAQGLYQGKIDGIWGPETDRAYCDYCAIREIEGR